MIATFLAVGLKEFQIWFRSKAILLSNLGLPIVILVLLGSSITISLKGYPVGLYLEEPKLASVVEDLELEEELKLLTYQDLSRAQADLEAGRIQALIIIQKGTIFHPLELRTPGTNALIDQQIWSVLTRGLAEKTPEFEGFVTHSSIHAVDFRDFLMSGLIGYLVLFLTALNVGIPWIIEWRDKTYSNLLLCPASRAAVIGAKVLAGLIQTAFILAVAIAATKVLMGYQLGSSYGLLALYLASAVASYGGLGLLLACLTSNYRLFVASVSLGSTVLMFISGTITPLAAMPAWERWVALALPHYYLVDALRGAALGLKASWALDLAVLSLYGAGAYLLSWLLLARREAYLS
jgi:ABC-2 type transport system permease protein